MNRMTIQLIKVALGLPSSPGAGALGLGASIGKSTQPKPPLPSTPQAGVPGMNPPAPRPAALPPAAPAAGPARVPNTQ